MDTAQPLVSLTNATLKLGKRTLWENMQLSIAPGEFVAVLGPNGAGKSSLIKTLLGLYDMTAGSVTVLSKKPKEARDDIGYIPQQKAFDRDVPISGRDLVTFGLAGNRWFVAPLAEHEKKRINAAIKEVGASAYADKPLGALSGGEQQRLRIAQAIVNSPQLLLCDEPLLSLDMASQQNVGTILDERRKKGTAIVFVTHEINPVLPFVDRVVYIVGGKWTVGKPHEVLTSTRLTALYGVPVEVLRVHGRILVISANEETPTQPQDAHHHIHESEDM